MSDGTFSTTLAASFGPNDLVATIHDDPTATIAPPAYFIIESGSETSLIRELVYFDGPFTGSHLETTTLDHRYLAGSTSGSSITHPTGAAVRMLRVPPFIASHWCSDQKRVDIAHAAGLNGIEYVEVVGGGSRLEVHLLSPEPGLGPQNFVVEGGDVVTDIVVTGAAAAGPVWTITFDRVGDHSRYRIRLVSTGAGEPESSGPPSGFDPVLSLIDFRFHIDAVDRFDCRHDVACLSEPAEAPVIDYLAKDYPSFRRLMLDRLSLHLDLEDEANPADLITTLVETIAYRADHLSYYQDAVATEAYLGTARRRESVRRHARILDYRLAEGCNARAWIAVTVGAANENGLEVDLPGPAVGSTEHPLPYGHDPSGSPGTRFLAGVPDRDRVSPGEVGNLVAGGAIVFESLNGIRARSAHNRLRIYTWGDVECCLPEGTTRATLAGDPLDDPIRLEPGDVVLFEEVVSPQTGAGADADPIKRHAARLTAVDPVVDPANRELQLVGIEWHELDALPFALCVSARILVGEDMRLVEDLAVVRGNVVLADHGYRVSEADDPTTPDVVEGLPPVPATPWHRAYRAFLQTEHLTFAAPYADRDARRAAATSAMATDWSSAYPAAWVEFGDTTWRPRLDLLASDRFAHEFTVEMSSRRRAALRFGDDMYGRAPRPGETPRAVYRVGTGLAGNVGAEAITTIVDDGTTALAVRNPLPAGAGRPPETVEAARRDAPQAFRVQQRAVTPDDYEEVAQRHPEVARCAVTRRWTGSWHTIYLTVDRRNGAPIDQGFGDDLRSFLERFRLTGHDLEIDGPRFVPLDIALTVRVADGYHVEDVEKAVRSRLSSGVTGDGHAGFFHPDRFTFGQPVYLSRLLAAVSEVPGVEWADLGNSPSSGHRFDRLLEPSGDAVEIGYVDIGRLEIARLDSDPDHPDRGRLEILMEAAP
ncbi:MAG TPA: putative baseplate assembly protein [Acidimicrobiia bacterium]|nr:putative baseplate assembly protein [Acidimicrobiia bacterium]